MFILDRPSSTKPTFIFIKTTLCDGSFKASTRLKVLPSQWSHSTKRAEIMGLDKATIENNKSINALLSLVEKFVDEKRISARYNGKHLSCQELKQKVDEITGKKKTGLSFYDHCELVIEEMREGKILTPSGKIYSKMSIKNYRQSIKTFQRFKPELSFNDIDMEFYRSFIKRCNDLDYSMNFLGQHIKNLIKLLKITLKKGLHTNTIFLDDDFVMPGEQTEDIHLDPPEIDSIYKKHLPNKTLDLARDWFIIASFTGLRVSDIQLLEDKHISNGMIQLVSEKTDTRVVLPMRPEIKAILKKWKGLPPKISDQELNRSIKQVCELCKINDPVVYFLTKGGKRKDYYLKKYELVSNHTARRSFITNLLNAGVPDNQVMQLAGIKKHSTLLRYKKTKPEDNARIMAEHSFFKGVRGFR
jgi:integrase